MQCVYKNGCGIPRNRLVTRRKNGRDDAGRNVHSQFENMYMQLVDADLIAVLVWLNTVGHICVRAFMHADEHSAPNVLEYLVNVVP